MAQPSQIVPTVTMNVSGAKQQVNLRDYLNVRVAPFLKKAVHDSLEAEAQYPLQWLGEHLIQQSILYEGNPDATNIKERFVYNHDVLSLPKSVASTNHSADSAPVHSDAAATGAALVNGTEGQDAQPGSEMQDGLIPEESANAIPSDQQHEDRTKDIEMGGTS